MALELDCRIVSKQAVQSGRSSRGEWQKQEFVIEYRDGNFPAQVCMSVWGADKVADLAKFQVGDQVRVSFNLSSREYSGRWYTDVRVWRMVSAAQASANPSPQTPIAASYANPPQPAPMPTVEDMPSGDFDSDDLPF